MFCNYFAWFRRNESGVSGSNNMSMFLNGGTIVPEFEVSEQHGIMLFRYDFVSCQPQHYPWVVFRFEKGQDSTYSHSFVCFFIYFFFIFLFFFIFSNLQIDATRIVMIQCSVGDSEISSSCSGLKKKVFAQNFSAARACVRRCKSRWF